MSDDVTQAYIFVAKKQLLLVCDGSSGALENPGHMNMIDPAQYIGQSQVAIKTVWAISCTCVRI